MAEPNMRTVTAAGIDLIVVELCDRRQGPGDPLLEWCFQSELENYLYSNWQTRGSFFKLLSRAGADGQSLCLRRKAVDEGLVTDAEFIGMRNAINRAARVFTVVPLAAIKLALKTYGSNPDGGDVPRDEHCPSTDEEVDPPDVEHKDKAPRTASYTLAEIPVELEVELSALEEWRTSPINQNRKGAAVADITSDNQRKNILRLLGWLVHQKKLARPTLMAFASEQIGAATQLYVKFLLDEKGRKYSSIAQYLSCFISAAQFVQSRRADASSKPVDNLKSMHAQAMQMARQQATFEQTTPSKPTLDWADVQRARCRAEEALAALGQGADPVKRQELTRDVALMMCLTAQAPDRVGVTRLLKLGSTLKRAEDGGFQLDLSQPGDHKTIATFGPSITTVPATITSALKRHIALAAVPHSGYIFTAPANPFEPLQPVQWTRLVKALFMSYSGVALAPKDLRSSHVTWLKSGDHDDETLRSAAQAMRHSSKTQDSTAYNKGKSNRLVQRSVDAAAAFAAKFSPGAGAA